MNLKKKIYWMLLLVGMSYFAYGASQALSVTVGEIAQELTCTCGCNMLVSACEGTMECGAAAGIKDEIVTKLNQGQTKEEIIAFFVNQYGEKILSSPTKRGFNLTAWILPFAAVAAGIAVVCILLKTWASRKESEDEPLSVKQEDKVYVEKVERELRTFES
jgi:cytochrome c-type biogenesis protein CcmH